MPNLAEDPPQLPLALRPLTRYDLEAAAALPLTPSQLVWVPTPLFALAESAFEDALRLGFWAGDRLVGFGLVYAMGGIHWVARVYVGAPHQGQGYGRAAVQGLVTAVRRQTPQPDLRAAIHPANLAAQAAFRRAGFAPIGPIDAMETGWQWQPSA